jgi:beta-lactamase class A
MFTRTFLLLLLLLLPVQALSGPGQFDLVYLWDRSLDNVLDYQNRLEEVLDPAASSHLRIVSRDTGEYGLIYDLDGTSISSARLMIKHNEMLSGAGLADCLAIEDAGYHELYNISYGLGPNLESLKKQYSTVYRYLGSEVGKNLFIEETDNGNYTLIYRRRGDRSSTHAVARKHARLLKRKGISATLIAEKNYPVVFGESSHLDKTAPAAAPAARTDRVSRSARAAENPTSVTLISETAKKEPPDAAGATPLDVPETAPVVLATSSSSAGKKEIEQAIENFIKDLRRKGVISSEERTGWMVYDLTSRESLADINGELSFQAASMIKPFVALAFFHRVRQGELVYGPKSRRNMELMIQRSNNKSTNWVMRMAGGPSRCNDILRTHYPNIFKNTVITEYIPPGGKTYKNVAQPSDYVRFLQALWDDRLPYSREIRRLMSLPGRDRLYDHTPIPQGTLVYNKTGSTAYLCGDMGILVPRDKNGNPHPYALVGIIQRNSRARNYGQWMLTRGNVIRQVSTLVYQEMKKHQLL